MARPAGGGRLRGYVRAAAQLHRGQSSVSHTVTKLQEQPGARLPEIEGRKARLTEAGESLLRRSRQLVAQAAETEIHVAIDSAFPAVLPVTPLKQFVPLDCGTRVQLREAVPSGAHLPQQTVRGDTPQD